MDLAYLLAWALILHARLEGQSYVTQSRAVLYWALLMFHQEHHNIALKYSIIISSLTFQTSNYIHGTYIAMINEEK